MPAAKKTPPPSPRWGISLAVLIALCAAFSALDRALSDNGWWFIAVGIATLVTLTIAGVRSFSRWRWLPPADS